MRALLLALLVTLSCAGIAQDKIYKVRTPDGRILFTDRPPAGAVIVEERDAPPVSPAAAPQSPPARRDGQPRPQQRQTAEADETSRDRTTQVDQAYAAVQAAEQELVAARQQLAANRAPQPGEMVGTARGGVRPAPAYQERVAGLEKAVADAEQKLARALENLNAVR